MGSSGWEMLLLSDSVGWGCRWGLSVVGEGAAATLTLALALHLGTLSNSCVLHSIAQGAS